MRDEQPELLLVEEDQILPDITAFRLELLGYRVTCTHSAQDALLKLDESTPDLIILDTVLPDADGIDFVDRLKNDARFNSVPVMVFSIDSDLDTVERAHTAGANEFLVTPYDPMVLEAKVEKLLNAVTA